MEMLYPTIQTFILVKMSYCVLYLIVLAATIESNCAHYAGLDVQLV